MKHKFFVYAVIVTIISCGGSWIGFFSSLTDGAGGSWNSSTGGGGGSYGGGIGGGHK